MTALAPTQRLAFSINEVAEMSGLPAQAIRDAIDDGLLEARYLSPRCLRLTAASVLRWMRDNAGVAYGEPATHVVYRLYDADDRLLYIGTTNNVTKRVAEHRRLARFGSLIHRVESSPKRPRTIALRLEARAIREEAPPYNVQHRGVPGWLLAANPEWTPADVESRLRDLGWVAS